MDGGDVRELHPTDPSPTVAGSTLVVFGDQDQDVYARAYFAESVFSEEKLTSTLAALHEDVVKDGGWPSKVTAAYLREARPDGFWHSDCSSAHMKNPETRYYVRMNTGTGRAELRKYPGPFQTVREPDLSDEAKRC